MRTEIIAAAGIVAASVVGVRLFDARSAPVMEAKAEPVAATQPEAQLASLAPGWDDVIRITAAPDHQFYVKADVNRSPARFLVDTGAAYVALRDSDAREAGIYTSWTDYTYPVYTANGETKAAFVTIDEMEIEGIRIEGVKAFILQDDQLKINLLGMSFLSRLESVEARKGELLIRG
ncbi:TIGR02281 family clan AA aspartic protease [Hyphococcus flavus]|uniref:TIGR02281 family clan AA aspartic protease n=1 Tax=Hyphococcus flavus TaxID=1866326 RepID=A0AAE9ZH73_9PROT|nr:TIGR02281 family clan AA aspartic protease [Hyphococcus flavus]WDI32732.1 TIGR02281 family clan AA aspartic protease [Hyphococcus flavus]